MLLKATTLSAGANPGDASGAALVELPTDNLSADQLEEFVAKRIGIVLSHHHGSHDISDVIALAQKAPARALNIVIPATVDVEKTKAAFTVWTQTAQQAGLTVCFETTAAVLEAANAVALTETTPGVRVTLNLASLNLPDHSPTDPATYLSKLKPVIDCADMIRVIESSPPLPIDTTRLIWENAMRQWRRQNKPGSTMLGLLHPENGPLWPAMQDAWKASARPR